MNGLRGTTGIGIALGGVGGAIAALMGAPKAPAPAPAPPPPAAVVPDVAEPDARAFAPAGAAVAAPATSATSAPSAVPAASAALAAPGVSADSAAPPPAASAAASPTVIAAPALDIPSTREALLRAQMLCDRKKDFDACAAAAVALETGTTGPADLPQAKRFRRIALTHLVAQCEALSPHACFVLAAKYRAGTELARNPTSAEALEKRGAELCRLGRTAPECPPS